MEPKKEKKEIIFDMVNRDEILYSLGRDRYSQAVRRNTKKAGRDEGGDLFELDARGLMAALTLMPENEQIAVTYFSMWNRRHPEDYQKFLDSDDSKLGGE